MLFSLGSGLAVCTVVALAAMQTVQVGQGGLNYGPNTLSAASGDTVQFTFNGAHSVTQSTFSDPCTASGFDSGVMSSGTYTITVNDTNPIWIHCSVSGHCQGGMVMAINAPASGMTFAAFQDAAEGKAAPSSAGASESMSSAPSSSAMSSASMTMSSPVPAAMSTAATPSGAACKSYSRAGFDTKFSSGLLGVALIVAAALF